MGRIETAFDSGTLMFGVVAGAAVLGKELLVVVVDAAVVVDKNLVA